MEIIQSIEPSGGKFLVVDDGIESGKLLFTLEENSLTIHHTLVKPRFKGKNIGTMLVMEAVYFARSHNLKIITICHFARSVFEKREDLRDVL